jgi:hypothetical protein
MYVQSMNVTLCPKEWVDSLSPVRLALLRPVYFAAHAAPD